jgi:ATP-dependent Lhr-like helicase
VGADCNDVAVEQFSTPTREWFRAAFTEPTAAQVGAWRSISANRHTLVVAPTGSGKTLSAFLHAIDRLTTTPPPPERKLRSRVLYVSPLKALGVDVERNLRAPLVGIRQTGERLGIEVPELSVGIRSGDTTPAERRRLQTRPPDVLITTPESLFLMLTSQARDSLRGVETVIIDEIHAVAGSKRGSHLALSLERLDQLLPRPAQRIGLSATVRPIDEVARFLGGTTPVEVVAPPADKQWALSVVVPVADMTELDDGEGERSGSLWPHVEANVLDLVEKHRSTIIFANSRRLAERLTARLNELAAERAGVAPSGAQPRTPAEQMAQSGQTKGVTPIVAKAHHGSVSKEQRALIEDDLKRGLLPAVVATSSLELGIDMGAVDLVIQIEAPPSVASALQRVGRAGHQVGEVSRGVLFPKHRGDLIPTAVTVEQMRVGGIEALQVLRNPLDVLAQQIVAALAMDEWSVDDLFSMIIRSAPYASLPRSAFEATLDLLSGRYPSDEFAELRPRIVWDRVTGMAQGRPGAQRLAVTSGGTIPDRGMFGVFLIGEKASRVGELDEEMVYESRVGDVFTLGTSSWRIEDITHDRVLVSPAPGQPGRLPFWTGDTLGRPAELGKRIGEFTRELSALPRESATDRALASGLDQWASDNLVALLAEQQEATGVIPHDQQLVVERFHDELGDWRLVVHSPYGTPVHAPWALAINARLRERYGVDAQAMAADDGVVLRIPETDQDPPGADLIVFDPDELEEIITNEIGGSALFAARFRESAARALLLPRRDPGRRAPLWQQRQRSAQLLEVASRYPSFPIILETVREVLQDVYDVPSLLDLTRQIAKRQVRVVDVATNRPSPFATTLLFGYVAQFMYEGDNPLAERRAAALTLDQGLLAELLGRTELRELLNPEVLAEVESELQRVAEGRGAKGIEGVVDLLRGLGPLTTEEISQRCLTPAEIPKWLEALQAERRVVQVPIAGEERWAVIEDVARLRDALGVPVPLGTPSAFTEPVADPLGDLISRFARTHGPFTAAEVGARFGLGSAVVEQTLHRLAADGRVLEGEFRPTGSGGEWCSTEVLRMLRRRSLARLRKDVEPVEPAVLGRFLPAWQHVGGKLRGVDGLVTVIEQLAGAPLPASALETLVLPARVVDYRPEMLDELTTSGEVLWAGAGEIPGNDGWISLHLAGSASLTLPVPQTSDESEVWTQIRQQLSGGGAFFFRQLSDAIGATDDQALAQTLWAMTWAGLLSNDSLTPLRALTSGRGAHRSPNRPQRLRAARVRRPAAPTRSGPPQVAGRWFALPDAEPDKSGPDNTGSNNTGSDNTVRLHARTELLLERHGVLTRGVVLAEEVPGGFAGVYRIASAMEEAGRVRRGYFVEGLGAAQFGAPGAIDRLRTFSEPGPEPTAVALAATDPANPFGAALPWPPQEGGHRPGRKAGAIVVLVDGELALYVERGGRTLLTFPNEHLDLAIAALGDAVRRGGLGRLVVEKVDGASIFGPESGQVREAMEQAGFVVTPRGLRMRV